MKRKVLAAGRKHLFRGMGTPVEIECVRLDLLVVFLRTIKLLLCWFDSLFSDRVEGAAERG